MVNLFIANLDWDITSEDLESTFSAFGPVTYAHVVYDNATKRSKGFGYIEMVETDHGINAINALNGMDINGRKLDVKIASPKGNRPPKSIQKPVAKKVEKKASEHLILPIISAIPKCRQIAVIKLSISDLFNVDISLPISSARSKIAFSRSAFFVAPSIFFVSLMESPEK